MNRPHHLDEPVDDATNIAGLEGSFEQRAKRHWKTITSALILLALSLGGCGMPQKDELWPSDGVVSTQVRALQKSIGNTGAQPTVGAQDAPPAPTIRCMPTLGAVDCYQEEPAIPPAPQAIAAPVPTPTPTPAAPPEAPVNARPLPAPTPLTPVN